MLDLIRICEEFYNKKSLIKVVRKEKEGFSIGFIKSIDDESIIVENDRTGLKSFIKFNSIDEVHEMIGSGKDGRD